MGKKVIILCGSPRKKGNTHRLIEYVKHGAQEKGAEVEVIDVTQLNYKVNGCIACMGCKTGEKFECVIDDEAGQLLKRLPAYDVVVVATPIYWVGPSAQLKMFLDRTYSFIKFDPETHQPIHNLKWKVFALVATAGGDLNSGLKQVDETYRVAVGFLGGIEYKSFLVPFAPMNPEDIEKNRDLCLQAKEFGKNLV